jgi:hypothetical protein
VPTSANAAAPRILPGSPGSKRALRLVTVMLVVAALALGSAAFIQAWNMKSILSNGAKEAAQVAISAPLTAKSCAGTPCTIESAAAAVKQRLINARLGRASCLTPNHPSFSGVLVWVFSCGAVSSGDCNSKIRAVCLKIDMTVTIAGPNQTRVPCTRVTVLYPSAWIPGLVLTSEATIPFPPTFFSHHTFPQVSLLHTAI